jgi:teichuronic acid biosynthesis glycosyltransferase TuaG
MIPSVSVIIPVFNAELYIEDTLSSIVSQTVKLDEIIIIDDCSSDNSVKIAKSFSSSYNQIHWVFHTSQFNLGPGNSRNIGLSLARNKLISFCDADDLWFPEKIEMQLSYIDKYHIIASSYVQFNSKITRKINLGGLYAYKDFLIDNYIPMSTVLINYQHLDVDKIVFKNIVHEDYLYWLEIFKRNKHCTVKVLDNELMKYRIHSNNYSKGFFKKLVSTFKVYKVHTKSNIFSVYFLIRRLYFILRKYYF